MMSESIYYNMKEVSALAPSLAAQVARDMGRRIVSRAYAPGDLVDDERMLAEHYQVSRSVVRDAVKILVGKGLLEVRRGIGTKVRSRAHWGLLDDDVLAWYQSAPPDRDVLRQLVEIRRAIEPRASRWAAERATEEQLGRIEAAVDRMAAEKGAIENFVVADAQFHRSVIRAANNEFVAAMEGVIFSALLSSIRLTNRDPRENEDSVPFHREVFLAIRDRKGSKAEQVMEHLLSDANRRLEERLAQAPGETNIDRQWSVSRYAAQ